MPNNNDDVLNAINNKLTVLVNLLLKKEEMSVVEKVAFMDSLNLPNKEAAQIIGISETHYKSAKSKIKKKSNNNNSGEPQNGDGTEQGSSESTA